MPSILPMDATRGEIRFRFRGREVALSGFSPRLTLLALGISFLLGLLSGLLPARNASRLSITDALGRV